MRNTVWRTRRAVTLLPPSAQRLRLLPLSFGYVTGDVNRSLDAADDLIALALDQRDPVVVIVLALDLRNLAVPSGLL